MFPPCVSSATMQPSVYRTAPEEAPHSRREHPSLALTPAIAGHEDMA